MIGDAVARGATLRTGGRRIGNQGWFFQPTVLTDVPKDAEIMNEEPLGPVVIVNRFAADDDAIAEANRLRYGLAAYAWTRSSARAQRLQDEIQAGMLTINHIGLSSPEVPFGGIGESGMGTEGGSEAIEAYLQTRFVMRLGQRFGAESLVQLFVPGAWPAMRARPRCTCSAPWTEVRKSVPVLLLLRALRTCQGLGGDSSKPG